MDLLLILTYTALCVAVFKIFRIPLNKWTVPTAVLGGIILIGALLLLMNYNHPYSETARNYYATTPVISQLRGRVIDVPVKPNVPLKKGDVLFRIDPQPFQDTINGLRARLLAAQEELERAKNLFEQGAGSERDMEIAQSRTDDLSAQLDNAEFDLEQATVVASRDGFVTQLVLQPGAMALPLVPVMTLVHRESSGVVAWFRQNSLLRLNAGDEAEVAFDAIPGVIFKGEVGYLLPAIAEGQIQPTGTLLSYGMENIPGREAVFIEITDPAFDNYRDRLPGGLFGQAAVYSEHFHHVAIIRKVLLRMAAWMNYVFPMH